jgi:hypothetical protein
VLVRRLPETAATILPLLERLREQILLLGTADAADLDEVVSEFGNPESALTTYSPILVSARGRFPW